MLNGLILYCKDQAVLWEACKTRPCKTDKCLFGRAVKMFGTDELYSPVPVRYSSVASMARDKEKLLKKPDFDHQNGTGNIPELSQEPVKGGVEIVG